MAWPTESVTSRQLPWAETNSVYKFHSNRMNGTWNSANSLLPRKIYIWITRKYIWRVSIVLKLSKAKILFNEFFHWKPVLDCTLLPLFYLFSLISGNTYFWLIMLAMNEKSLQIYTRQILQINNNSLLNLCSTHIYIAYIFMWVNALYSIASLYHYLSQNIEMNENMKQISY